MEFFAEGGWGMWATLAFFVGGGALAIARRTRGGERIAFGAAVAVVASGLLGFSTGLHATAMYVSRLPVEEQAEMLSIGMRESSNNTIFAGALAIALGLLGLALAGRRHLAATHEE